MSAPPGTRERPREAPGHGPADGPRRRLPPRPFVEAWLAATVLSGLPSTVHALATGADPWEATMAAGAMLVGPDRSFAETFVAAGIVHATVSAFWATVLYRLRPRRHVLPWSVVAAAAIGLLDLRGIAPRVFPEVAALPFWPQMADHLAWGACFGAALARRERLGA